MECFHEIKHVQS